MCREYFTTIARRGLAALAITLALSGSALAQAWPSKPIRMIVPYTPGGYTDFMARTVGQGIVAVGNTPEEYQAFVAEEIARWAKVIKDAGIKMEEWAGGVIRCPRRAELAQVVPEPLDLLDGQLFLFQRDNRHLHQHVERQLGTAARNLSALVPIGIFYRPALEIALVPGGDPDAQVAEAIGLGKRWHHRGVSGRIC
jgi:hypothetical protein